MNFDHLHPAIVHFPIALLIVVAILGIISLFKETLFLKRMIFWLLVMAILFAVLAIASGLYEENRIAHNEAIHEIMEKHETNAFIVAGYFVALFIWFWLRKMITHKVEYTIWVILAVAGCGLLAYQNDLGGKMVYEHGAAVKPMQHQLGQESGHDHHSE